MTPDELALVQSTFTEVKERSADVSPAFYRRLCAAAPELRDLFPADMEAQHRKFMDELTAIVEAVTDLDRMLDRTMPLGRRHLEYGARPSHYRLVGDALLATFADELGERWTPEAAAAWTLAYRLVAETMLQGASSPAGP